MFVLGLTGSIGMGKSTTAAMFREAGVPVHDSDAAVHALYRGAAAPLVEAAFPGTLRGGEIDRARLSALVIHDAAALKRLEAIVHPLVRAARAEFIAAARVAGADLVVLDIPLLYETGCESEVDAVVARHRTGRGAKGPDRRASWHDRGQACRHNRQANAGCRKAPPRRYHPRHKLRPCRGRAAGARAHRRHPRRPR